ncbi:bifunctional 3,4-dihydroxy-2-butanone-4-phosphate synthase/GTP cyclohydrolase II [Parvibium lacunae]|uniref:3,4-dihydroxy-2-butanone 4-phosphate synthase n=1 Tax=Parvibium lacunae TaxID=1888893 RepID=A0A368L4M6_9BURK|nr:bifunctional 3,4-dihydroxy-2-butanone-4-phosphate synthase/GTP cyclohydrolase II [Parvibium lacunae]RCS58541.1 3,4-dihydroxy-2-butanone-4-phosphate synthase [Parvibium lacunae]
MPSTAIAAVQEIIADLRQGRMVILVDEEDRENEGDLVMAAEFVTPEAINFMAKYGRGLICLTLTAEKCAQLNLRPMVSNNQAQHGTNFTVSIEAAQGVTTGISAADRAHTIRVAVARDAKPTDIVQPGHIFPLRAQPGGVLMRAGHTEAGCDLAALAGLMPAAVICEILKEDGTMARLPDLQLFAAQHELKIGTIADLIHYRSTHESLIECIGERTLTAPYGTFRSRMYRDTPSGATHLALIHGQPRPDQETWVRVHEPTSLLDLLEQQESTHSWSIRAAAQCLQHHAAGVLILLNCNPGDAFLQEQFRYLAATQATAPQTPNAALRTYGIGAQILRDLQVRQMRLLAHPRKMPSMLGFDLQVTGFLCYDDWLSQPPQQTTTDKE